MLCSHNHTFSPDSICPNLSFENIFSITSADSRPTAQSADIHGVLSVDQTHLQQPAASTLAPQAPSFLSVHPNPYISTPAGQGQEALFLLW